VGAGRQTPDRSQIRELLPEQPGVGAAQVGNFREIIQVSILGNLVYAQIGSYVYNLLLRAWVMSSEITDWNIFVGFLNQISSHNMKM
jgi:hypothetical protein